MSPNRQLNRLTHRYRPKMTKKLAIFRNFQSNTWRKINKETNMVRKLEIRRNCTDKICQLLDSNQGQRIQDLSFSRI